MVGPLLIILARVLHVSQAEWGLGSTLLKACLRNSVGIFLSVKSARDRIARRNRRHELVVLLRVFFQLQHVDHRILTLQSR